MKLSRRALLLGSSAAAIAAVGAAGVVLGGGLSLRGWVVGTIRALVPPERLAGVDLDAFAADYLAQANPGRRVALLAAGGGLGHDAVAALGNSSQRYEDARRDVLTTFLLSTDYFSHPESASAPITYFGVAPSYCATANPFAQFLEV